MIRWLLAVVALGSALPLSAQSFPALSGRVVDAANIIPDAQEAALDAQLAAVETNSGRQVVVATIPSLEGYPIDDYGYRLGRSWGIGQKADNNGALLIIAPKDRKVRIEVGYGLEPILTDAWSSVVINTQILPRFKAGDYPGGIAAGVNQIASQLQLPPEEAAKRAQAVAANSRKADRGGNGGAILFWILIFVFLILPMMRGMFGGGRGRRYGSGPIVIWGGNDWGGGSGGGGFGGGFGGGGGGFSGGGGSFGGGGASGGW